MPKIIKIVKGEKPIRAHNKEEKKPARGYIIEENKPAGASFGQERKPAGAIYGQEELMEEVPYFGPRTKLEYELLWGNFDITPTAVERASARDRWEAHERAEAAEARVEILYGVIERALLEIDHLREAMGETDRFNRDLIRDSQIMQAQIDKLRAELKEEKEKVYELIDLDN